MNECLFCKIADKSLDAVILWEDNDLLVFLDHCPVREAHCQIITKEHYETFEAMPPELAAKVLHIGQRLARKMKTIYNVDRVAFLFTGGDVLHVHAHLIPMYEKTDITSARYIANSEAVQFSSDHLMKSKYDLEIARTKIGNF